MQQALQNAKMTSSEIDKIILVGIATSTPWVREFVATFMDKEPERGVDPLEAVAIGASIQAAIIGKI